MPQATSDTLTKVEVVANLEPVVHTLMGAHAAKRVLWLLAAHLGGNTFWSTWPKRWPAEGDRHGAVLHDYASAFAVAVARASEMTSRRRARCTCPPTWPWVYGKHMAASTASTLRRTCEARSPGVRDDFDAALAQAGAEPRRGRLGPSSADRRRRELAPVDKGYYQPLPRPVFIITG